MAGGKLSPKEERELFELKQRAMAFYEENGVPQRMEEILNSMFYDAPNDVYGHLVSSFNILCHKQYYIMSFLHNYFAPLCKFKCLTEELPS